MVESSDLQLADRQRLIDLRASGFHHNAVVAAHSAVAITAVNRVNTSTARSATKDAERLSGIVLLIVFMVVPNNTTSCSYCGRPTGKSQHNSASWVDRSHLDTPERTGLEGDGHRHVKMHRIAGSVITDGGPAWVRGPQAHGADR